MTSVGYILGVERAIKLSKFLITAKGPSWLLPFQSESLVLHRHWRRLPLAGGHIVTGPGVCSALCCHPLCELSVLPPALCPAVAASPRGSVYSFPLIGGLRPPPDPAWAPNSESLQERAPRGSSLADTGSAQLEGQGAAECGWSPHLMGWARPGSRVWPGHRDRQQAVWAARGSLHPSCQLRPG